MMTVCYWGTYDRDYPRNRILMEGLRENGAEVLECHYPLWHSSADKVERARSGWFRPSLMLRWLWAYLVLSARFLKLPRPDFLFVGYSGHFDVFPAWCLGRLRKIPVVLDVFLSLYDSIVLDRRAAKVGSLKAKLLAWIDRTACRLADRVLLDTQAHIDFFCQTYRLSREKFWRLPIGADDRVFRGEVAVSGNQSPYTILHFGRYIPLHGLETVVRAARRLQEEEGEYRFLLVGEGEERGRIERLAREVGTKSVVFRDTEPPERLAETIRKADVCLGIFGTTEKADRVVPNKVYEAMAMGKPVITGDSAAAREFLSDGVDCLLVERGDACVLAEAIQKLKNDEALCRRLGRNARRRFEELASPAVIGKTLRINLETWRATE